MPRPWEFQIEFDQKTGHLTRVVQGDNTRYADYIKAQNHAIDTSTVMVKRLTGASLQQDTSWCASVHPTELAA